MAGPIILVAFVVVVAAGLTISKRKQRQRAAFRTEYQSPLDSQPCPPHEWQPLPAGDATPRVLFPHKFFLGTESADTVIDAQWTAIGGVQIHVFDLLHRDRAATVRSSCAGFKIAASCPSLVIWPKAGGSPEGGATGWTPHMPTVKFESDAFNLMYLVRAEDQRFAFSFIDAEMMRFLLTVATINFLAISGSDVFVACQRGPDEPFDADAMLQVALGLQTRIPKIVVEQWGRNAPAG